MIIETELLIIETELLTDCNETLYSLVMDITNTVHEYSNEQMQCAISFSYVAYLNVSLWQKLLILTKRAECVEKKVLPISIQ